MRITIIAAALAVAILATLQVPKWVAPDDLGPKPCERTNTCP